MNQTNHLPSGYILQGSAYSYSIDKVLGQGTFGITYLATIKIQGPLGGLDNGIKVAIKEFFMRDINGRDDTAVTCSSNGNLYTDYKHKFTREALNLSKLQHPNIIKVIEFFEANNTAYYVMEYIDGGDLDHFIARRQGLDVNLSVSLTTGIGQALSFMHSRGMLHLDLKPANIMMRKDGTPVLIDFGLSKQYNTNGDPESSTTVGGGTPGYSPIEQANYHEGRGFPVTMDVYALGATMFKMLTGERPPDASDIFNDGFPIYILQEHNVDMALSSVVAKAMSPAKVNRYANVDEFLKALTSPTTDGATKKRTSNTKSAQTNKSTQKTGPTHTNTVNDSTVMLKTGTSANNDSNRTVLIDNNHKASSSDSNNRPRKANNYILRIHYGIVALVTQCLLAYIMFTQSREASPDSDGRKLNNLYLIASIAIGVYLIFNIKNIKTRVWVQITYASTALCILNSLLLPMWNGSLTSSYLILSIGLAFISAITWSVKKI